MKRNKFSVQRAEINHNIKLHYYAADGQIVAFTDHMVESLTRYIDENKRHIYTSADTADYNVIMILKDGFWKIKTIERLAPTLFQEKIDSLMNTELKQKHIDFLRTSKGINYYPQKTPWKDFWLKYDSTQIERDFQLIKKIDLNSVRIFINYEQFGRGIVIPEMLKRLDHLLNTAERNDLKVVITLFDFNSNYELLNFPSTDRQLETLLTRYKNHKALLAWDLKNEPDLDYHYQIEKDVREWLSFITKKAIIYDASHPITIGWAFPENADYLNEELDFISFHYYKDTKFLNSIVDSIRLFSKNKPLVIEEFGLSNYQSRIFPIGKSEAQQAKYLLDVINLCREKQNLSFFYWSLFDFENVSGEIAGIMPWQRNIQKHFGLIDKDGNPKQSYKVLSGERHAIELSTMDKIQPYWFTYLAMGLLFILGFATWKFKFQNKK